MKEQGNKKESANINLKKGMCSNSLVLPVK
jgi:hypothetical protein